MMPVHRECKQTHLLAGHARTRQGVKRTRSEESWEWAMKATAPDQSEKKWRFTEVKRKHRRPPRPRGIWEKTPPETEKEPSEGSGSIVKAYVKASGT